MKKNLLIEKIAYTIILAVLAVVFFNFYKIMIYMGDNEVHLNFARNLFERDPQIAKDFPTMPHIAAYPLYHLMVKLVVLVSGADYPVAGMLTLTLVNLVSIIMFRWLLLKITDIDTRSLSTASDYIKLMLIDVFSVSGIFFGTVKSFLTHYRYYERQCSANPWHNPTISMTRPLGLAATVFFVITLMCMESNRDYKKSLVGFGVFSFLSVAAKPNFAYILFPAAAILTLCFWGKSIKDNFSKALAILVSVIPSCVLILYQMLYMTDDANIKVRFAFGSFSEFTLIEVIMVTLAALPVPIAAFIICNKKEMLSNRWMMLGILAMLFGWFEMFFFTNGTTGDFSWGYDLAIGLSTIICLGFVLKAYWKKWQMYIVFITFFVQLYYGIEYFRLVYLNGGNYWF